MKVVAPWAGRGHILADASEDVEDLANTRLGRISGVPAPFGVWDAVDLLESGFANNDSVDSWPDATSNDNPFTQGTGAKQPLFKTGQVNGEPAVEFDGSDDLLVNTGFVTDYFPAARWRQARVQVFVMKYVANTNAQVASFGNSGNDTPFDMFQVDGNSNWSWQIRSDENDNSINDFTGSPTTGSWEIVTFFSLGNIAALVVDGALDSYLTTGQSKPLTSDNYALAALKRTSETTHIQMALAYHGIFPIMPVAQLNNLHGALGQRFGITVSTIT